MIRGYSSPPLPVRGMFQDSNWMLKIADNIEPSIYYVFASTNLHIYDINA